MFTINRFSAWQGFYVSHPVDNPDYHPADGADLVNGCKTTTCWARNSLKTGKSPGLLRYIPASRAAGSPMPMIAFICP